MTIIELGKIPSEMYENAPNGDKMAMIPIIIYSNKNIGKA
jgi:hypothetical protein